MKLRATKAFSSDGGGGCTGKERRRGVRGLGGHLRLRPFQRAISAGEGEKQPAAEGSRPALAAEAAHGPPARRGRAELSAQQTPSASSFPPLQPDPAAAWGSQLRGGAPPLALSPRGDLPSLAMAAVQLCASSLAGLAGIGTFPSHVLTLAESSSAQRSCR